MVLKHCLNRISWARERDALQILRLSNVIKNEFKNSEWSSYGNLTRCHYYNGSVLNLVASG